MWSNLPDNQKKEYKKMILAFASLTEMFAQKADNTDDEKPEFSPVINSKYQETVFQRVFHASAEDIGNTSYDASLKITDARGIERKYLIGIKTFGIASGAQKIAQFKAYNSEWAEIIALMRTNSRDTQGNVKAKAEIDRANHDLYLALAKELVRIRNARIDSSISNLQGFSVSDDDRNIQSVYHVLMTSAKGDEDKIFVGETTYDKINSENITITGCTKASNPTNFSFTDGIHTYRFTAADTQLLMDFNNRDIVIEEWEVQYAEDPYLIFSELATEIYGEEKTIEPVLEQSEIAESYSWKILNKDGIVEKYSGYNSFYGVGSKLGKEARKTRIESIKKKYSSKIGVDSMKRITDDLTCFLLENSRTDEEKTKKVELRRRLMEYVAGLDNSELENEIISIVYRPKDEMYIPIPNSRAFHNNHPDFFAPGAGTFIEGTAKLAKEKTEDRSFNLVFEPSGDSIPSYITQDYGKAIESREKQTDLGEWILRGVFQLEPYEPLTKKSLDKVGINGIRLFKCKDSPDVHIMFIWIDDDNLPTDYISNSDQV